MKNPKLHVGVMLILGAMALPAQATPSAKQLRALKAAVVANFKDPASAQFRKIGLASTGGSGETKPGEGIYCGEVNAKNSLGGYVGYMPFVGAILGEEAIAIYVAQDAGSTTVAVELCNQAKAGKLGR